MKWILILVVYTTDHTFIPYEQGIYNSFGECNDVKETMLKELGKSYRGTCIKWEIKK